jgi:hypothetical protein
LRNYLTKFLKLIELSTSSDLKKKSCRCWRWFACELLNCSISFRFNSTNYDCISWWINFANVRITSAWLLLLLIWRVLYHSQHNYLCRNFLQRSKSSARIGALIQIVQPQNTSEVFKFSLFSLNYSTYTQLLEYLQIHELTPWIVILLIFIPKFTLNF